MENSDYNVIKPVEALANVGNVSSAKRRKERKKQQDSQEQKKRKPKPVEERLKESNEKNIGRIFDENDKDENSIDFRA